MRVVLFCLLACGRTLELQDAHNYAYTGDMSIPSTATASGEDLSLCWEGLVEDLACHGIDPATDIELLSLIRFPHLDEAEVEAGISADDLTQSQLDGYVALETGGETCAQLSAFDFFGTPIDVPSEYTAEGGTYLLMLSSGTEPGQGARMLQFLAPSADSDVDLVDIGDGCGTLDFEARIEGSIAAPEGPWTIDWTALSTNGAGNPFEPTLVDRVTVGFFEGRSPEDLEQSFLDLELEATESLTVELSEVSARAEVDVPLRSGGTTLLALRCGTCSNPAPLFLTALEPR